MRAFARARRVLFKPRQALITGGAVVAALGGRTMGGDVGVAVGTLGTMAMPTFIEYLAELRQRRISRVLDEVGDQLGLTLQELMDELARDESRGELATRVLIAAQDAGTDEQLRALSTSLVRGICDASAIPIEVLCARAIAELDSSHIFVLSLFCKTWLDLGLSSEDVVGPTGLSYAQLCFVTELGDVLEPVVGLLLRHGLIAESRGRKGISFQEPARGTFQITPFGNGLLERMEIIGSAETGIEVQQDGSEGVDDLVEHPSTNCSDCAKPTQPLPTEVVPYYARIDPNDPSRPIIGPLPRLELCAECRRARITGSRKKL
jgi:hypothetical protein